MLSQSPLLIYEINTWAWLYDLSRQYRGAVTLATVPPAGWDALDGKDSIHNFEPWKRMVEERSRSFPLGIKWFLLNKLFQMRPAEIARMEGVKNPSAVRGLIIRVSDQLRCGEISLFETDQEEAEAAKARLEAKRAQRRERHTKNKDRINAQRRETYALKKST